MTTITNQSQTITRFETLLNKPIRLSIIIGLVLSGLFSIGWSRLTGYSTIAMWPLGFSVAFLLMSWLYLRRQHLAAWGLAIAGQIFGVIGISLLLIASLKM